MQRRDGAGEGRTVDFGLAIIFNDLVNDLVYISSMAQVGIHEAKTHLSRLLRRVAAGEVIVIAKGGVPLARLVPIHSRARRELGRDKDGVALPDDFDAPLDEDAVASTRS